MELQIVFSDAHLDQLADRVAAILASREPIARISPWLNVAAAAAHIGCPKSRIYALVSTKRIPHHRDGSRLLFDRSELDTWVRNGGGKRT